MIDEYRNRNTLYTQDNDENPLSEADRKLLQDFRIKINKLTNNYCLVCNECFPSIDLVREVCRRWYCNKNSVKKFSAANNMDLGELSDDL